MAGPRRNLLKTFFGVSLLATIAPFLSWGGFLYRPSKQEALRQRIANINDLGPNSRITFSFPATGDQKIDSDPFRQYGLIRLPTGEVKAYSKVCVHLWCLWDYFPSSREMQCPCHGSVYNPDTGVAIRGPAALQPYPTNALPELELEIDAQGNIYAKGLKGRVGYGREYKELLTPLQQLQQSSPDREVTVYIPLKEPMPVNSAQNLINSYGVRLVRAYGYRERSVQREGRKVIERDWLVGETQTEMAEMDAVYALDLAATPSQAIKIAENRQVITAMLRSI
ncbi:MAG: Rieske 2Fe-2S domain-containing protein [Nitrososphaerota archaeon]